MKIDLKGRNVWSWIVLSTLWGVILAVWLHNYGDLLSLAAATLVLSLIAWLSSLWKGWKMRIFSFVAILFTVVFILPFCLFMYGRIHESSAVSGIAPATNVNPLIRSDAEILGKWSGQNKTLVLSADKTFKYQTPEYVATGTWTRNDWNLYLKGNSNGCCNAMRFVTLHKQYFLLTEPPDFSEVEGDEWLDDAIASALRKAQPAPAPAAAEKK